MNINSNPSTTNHARIRRASVVLVGALALAVAACGTEEEISPAGQALPEANASQRAPSRGPVTADAAERRAQQAAERLNANAGSVNGVPTVVYEAQVQEQQEAHTPVSRSPWPYRS
jgi:hypothetical protein